MTTKGRKILYFTSAIIFNMLFAWIVILYAEMFRVFFDNAQSGVSSDYLSNFFILLAYIGLQTLFHYIGSIATNRLYLLNKEDLQKSFFESVMTRDLKHIRAYSSGRLQSVMMHDIDAIAHLTSYTYIKAIHIIVKTLMFVTYLLTINLLLGFISILIGPILVVFGLMFSKSIRNTSNKHSIELSHLNDQYNNFFEYNMFFKLFDSKAYMEDQFEKSMTAYNKVAKRAFIVSNLFDELSSGLGQAANVTVLAAGAYMVSKSQLSTGELVAFMQIQNQVVWPLVSLNELYGKYQSTKGRRDLVKEIMSSPPEKNILTCHQDQKPLICLDQVDVSLGPKKILDRLSLNVAKGDLVLIMGDNGAGKSTLVNTLFGLYQPDQGQVTYQGQEDFIGHQMIEYNLQASTVIDGSIRDNLCLDEDFRDEDILDLCQRLRLLDDFDKGLDAHLHFDGNNISGGQARKIGLIRSLLSAKPILILDEPLAALDSLSKKQVVKELEKLRKSKTIIVINHGREFLDLSDRIIFFHQGRVIESTYDQLKEDQSFIKFLEGDQDQ